MELENQNIESVRNTVSDLLEELVSLVDGEFKDAKILKGIALECLTKLTNITWTPNVCFFNSTSIILTNIEDYNQILDNSNCKEYLRLESEYFNIGFFIVNYIEDKKLSNALASYV